jgi:hypothetical protein
MPEGMARAAASCPEYRLKVAGMTFRDVPHAAASLGTLLTLARFLTPLVFVRETGRASVTGDVVARAGRESD